MILFVVSAYSQKKLTSEQWRDIQKSGDYVIGMGMSESMDHARLVAMSDLVGKISTVVKSRFEYVLGNKDNKESKSYMEKVIRTYSSVKLNNVSEYVEEAHHGKYIVYRYMKNSERYDMFKRRLNTARNWVRVAEEREKEGKIGDALQAYYWSLALLRSCPDGDMETIGDNSFILTVNQQIKNVLSNITVRAISSEKEGNSQRLTLSINYKGLPIVNFNYKFLKGKHISSVYSAKDGIGELLLPPNVSTKRLKIQAEYEFRDEANILPELKSVMETLDPVPFQAAEISVNTDDCPMVNSTDYVMIVPSRDGVDNVLSESKHESPYISTIRKIEQSIVNKNFDSLESCFTQEGWDMFNKLITYGEARLLKSPEVQFIPDGNKMVCRGFPMSFTFKGNKRTFTEDVVFYLDETNKVCEVAFGLEKAAVDDIMNRGQWSDVVRHQMIHFLETYKTAYALKRLDYIKSIFSNEALIITGSVVKGTKQTELSPAKMEHVKYIRQTKEQYMKSLERCFRSNEYINLHFVDNIVRASGNPNIYGIQIKQNYFSSTYGDTGYLFLLLDFKDPESPIIHVRTWQPDDNPNLKDGRIGIADFKI